MAGLVQRGDGVEGVQTGTGRPRLVMQWGVRVRSRNRGWRRLVAAAAAAGAACAVVAGPGSVAPSAAAEPPLTGNDISWPQCPPGVGSPRPGQGQPMPPPTARVLIIGLTDGVGFVANPCLKSQVAWARAHHTYTAGYANSGYPTEAEVATHGGSGPWPATDTLSRLRNTGYAEARFNVATMKATGFRTPMVWVDVEPNVIKPWSTNLTYNKAVVDGALRGYTDSGYAVGVYSVLSLWNIVLGPAVQYGLPEWRTVGPRGYDAALAACTGPSFNGGPAVIAQWWTSTTDYDVVCPAYTSSTELGRFFHRYAGPIPFGDFDGDGRTDRALFRPSTGTWHVRGVLSVQYGTAGDVPVGGDFDRDGLADLALFRPSTGTWYVRGLPPVRYGTRGDVPVSGDFTGDGRADLALFRPSTGTWYVRGAANTPYGTRGDLPVSGDFTGDGRADRAVFRPSNGTWYVQGMPAIAYGTQGDRPVPADYTGDGRTDLAVYRPSNGTWYVRGLPNTEYGVASDIPVPGDYDGDGRTDRAVFRPGTGTWHVLGSAAVRYGAPGDLPVRR